MKRTIHPALRGGLCTLSMVILGSMYAWSYFKVALGSAYPTWSQSNLSLTFTLVMSLYCLGALFAGSVLSRFLSKSGQVRLGGLLLLAGFVGVGLLPADPSRALLQLYLCYGILTGFGSGFAYNAILSSIPLWFPENTGTITGVLLMGLGIGSLILGLIASALLQVYSLSTTFLLFGAGAFVILQLCAFAVRPPLPGEVKAAGAATPTTEDTGFTTAEMLRRPTFWLYFLWNLVVAAAGMLVINSCSSIAVYYGLLAVAGLIVSVFNGMGRMLIGACMDRLGWKRTMYLHNLVFLFAAVLLLLGDRGGQAVVVMVGMLLVGVCYGGGVTIAAALIRTLYGSRHYATNFSVVNLCTIPAAILGPMLSAALQDGSGTYLSTFVMVIVMGAAAMVLNLFIRKP